MATALLLYEVARRNWMGALKGTDPAPRLQRLQLQGQQAQEIPAEAPVDRLRRRSCQRRWMRTSVFKAPLGFSFTMRGNPSSSMLRASANLLGLAWWARVESRNPDVTYWFGPFVRRSTLERELDTFLNDLRSESPAVLEHQLLRTRRSEPFTIEHRQG